MSFVVSCSVPQFAEHKQAGLACADDRRFGFQGTEAGFPTLTTQSDPSTKGEVVGGSLLCFFVFLRANRVLVYLHPPILGSNRPNVPAASFVP